MYIKYTARIEELRSAIAIKLSMADIAQHSKLADLEAAYRQQARDYETEIASIMRRQESR